jgi:hypothetical protein
MNAYHVNWSAPRRYTYQNWEILAQILSAEFWRRNVGPIRLICDEPALRVYEKLGITSLYREIEMLDLTLLEGIDPDIYFAAGKLAAQLQVPDDQCAFIDLDLILNYKQNPFNSTTPYFLHREIPVSPYYPNEKSWFWPIDFVHDVYALNCGISYLPNKELRREYAGLALQFMVNNRDYLHYEPNALMVTAEQRLLGMFLKAKGLEPSYFISDIYIPGNYGEQIVWYADDMGSNIKEKEAEFSHLWGSKRLLLNSHIDAAEMTVTLLALCEEMTELDVDKILYQLRKIL